MGSNWQSMIAVDLDGDPSRFIKIKVLKLLLTQMEPWVHEMIAIHLQLRTYMMSERFAVKLDSVLDLKGLFHLAICSF